MTNPRPPRLLVICTGNRARSQMAHGWLRSLGGDNVEVISAGTNPKGVHPMAVRVMDEVGIDISGHTSDHVDQYVEYGFDLVITVCDSARESCPAIPGAKRVLHQSFENPDCPGMADAKLTEFFRRVRDEIGDCCQWLVDHELTAKSGMEQTP